MSSLETFRLRVFFQKLGRCAMLSHLELARALERAIRRAALPYAISQGFSPHMKIAFGAALPVGVGGGKECFDLQLVSYVNPDEALVALQKSSVEDLMILSCDYISAQAPSAAVAYPVSVYEARLSCSESLGAVPEAITVVRKKKERELVVSEFLQGEFVQAGNTLTFSLLAKPSGSLRPDKLLEAMLASTKNTRLLSLTRIDQRVI